MGKISEHSGAMSEVADNAISLFRVNIFVIGVYVSLVALLYRAGVDIDGTLYSWYTDIGILFWVGTITACRYTTAGLVSTQFRQIRPLTLLGNRQSETSQVLG